MTTARSAIVAGLTVSLLTLSACSGNRAGAPVNTRPTEELMDEVLYQDRAKPRSTIWDFFRAKPDQGQVGAVNKYIWNAALDVLSFLPVQNVDPFTGVITTGYGTPPGGGRAYRATIYVSDPALEGRSLNLALMTRSGPVSASTTRAIEDAILTRARQLRAQDSKL